MTYAVKEVFATLQGEGSQAGRPAVFVRFAGCNLWNGRDTGRDAPACAQWCDTDFLGTDGPLGGKYDADTVAGVIMRAWANLEQDPFVVLTGGEPTLQIDDELVEALDSINADVAVETNGTRATPLPANWFVTVSPKGAYPVMRTSGHDLKLIHGQPEPEADPAVWEAAAWESRLDFWRYYLQPMEPLPGPEHDAEWQANVQAAIEYVREHPFWRLSLQTHKMVGLP